MEGHRLLTRRAEEPKVRVTSEETLGRSAEIAATSPNDSIQGQGKTWEEEEGAAYLLFSG